MDVFHNEITASIDKQVKDKLDLNETIIDHIQKEIIKQITYKGSDHSFYIKKSVPMHTNINEVDIEYIKNRYNNLLQEYNLQIKSLSITTDYFDEYPIVNSLSIWNLFLTKDRQQIWEILIEFRKKEKIKELY